MDWHEINMTEDAGPSPNDLTDTYLTEAREIWQKAGCPEHFRVFLKTTTNFDRILYFNPEARKECTGNGILSVGRSCSQPEDPGTQMIP